MAAKKKTATTPDWVQRIARKWEAARTLSGSKAKLKPALDDAALGALEKDLGATLPDDYRAFLRHFASGGPGPFDALLPPKKIERTKDRVGVVIGRNDHNVLASVDVKGPLAGKVTYFDEDLDKRVQIGTFADYYEAWLDQDLLGQALEDALEGAIEKQNQLPPEKHALVVEHAGILDRLAQGPLAAVPRGLFAVYMGDRSAAERICDELTGWEHDAEPLILDGSLHTLAVALYPAELETARTGDAKALAALVSHRSAYVRDWVACNAKTPAAALAKLTEDPSDGIRYSVAKHPNADAATLARILTFTEARWKKLGSSTRRLLALEAAARSPKLPPANAERIVKTYSGGKGLEPWLVRGAAAHPKLSVATLEKLAKHGNPVLQHAAATHPATTPNVLAALAGVLDSAVQKAVAFHPKTPPAVLAELTRHPERSVVEAAVWNVATPLPALLKLLAEGRSDLVDAFARVKRLPKAAKALVKKHPNYDEPDEDFDPPQIDDEGKQAIQTRSHRLGMGPYPRFAAHASAGEVWDVGAYAHPAFPVPILRPYVDEHDENGAREMADHPWLDDELLALLTSHRGDPILHSSTRAAAARHPRHSVATLEALAAEDDEHLSGAVAENPNTPIALLKRIANAKGDWARAGVAQNLRTPAATLMALAKDRVTFVRRCVAGNASAPPEALAILLTDKEPGPKEVAAWSKAARRG